MKSPEEIRRAIAMLQHLLPMLDADVMHTIAGSAMALEWALGGRPEFDEMFDPSTVRVRCGEAVYPKHMEHAQ